MTDEEIIKRWLEDKAVYQAWADYIVKNISEKLEDKYPLEEVGYPLKLPLFPRLKTAHSLVDKALYRNKYEGCDDAYAEIEDKVGIRFVTLLESEVEIITGIIAEEDSWCARKDRSIDDRLEKPDHFDYQSTHFVLYPKENIEIDGVTVSKSIACEVQIRTLLQHAWCELSHKIAYKPKAAATPETKRALAKSVALIEATSDYFDHAASKSFVQSDNYEKLYLKLKKLYETHCERRSVLVRSGEIIMDAVTELIPSTFSDDIAKMLEEKPYIVEKIKENADSNLLFSQPVSLLLYFLVYIKPNELKTHWPLTEEELSIFYTHLGVSFDNL